MRAVGDVLNKVADVDSALTRRAAIIGAKRDPPSRVRRSFCPWQATAGLRYLRTSYGILVPSVWDQCGYRLLKASDMIQEPYFTPVYA